jgi:hypothetical protein
MLISSSLLLTKLKPSQLFLVLKIDKNRETPGSMILLSGGGFGADEDRLHFDTE